MKKVLQAVCAFALSFSFHPFTLAASGAALDIPHEKFVLDNGLRVIIHEDRKAPIVAVSVWYHVGSKDEPEGRTGFAHLFEHIMFEGSENHNDSFNKPLDEVGATAQNGTTWFDRTNYFENVPTPALELALFLESDRMGHLLGALTQEKLDQERGVVQNEKREGDNQPYGLVYYRVLEGLFPPGHPYRHETIGSMADLNAATLEDVHNWFRQYYGAANAVLVLAGDITAEHGLHLAEKYFGDVAPGPALQKLQAWVPDRVANTHETLYDQVPQIRSYQNWAVPGRTTQDRALLELAATVLGDGKNSRLYQALVYDTQLAVDLDVSIDAQELASIFTIDTVLGSEASLDEVNAIIEHELARFLKNGPGEEELKRARSKITAAVARGLEQVGGFDGKAATLGQGELYDHNPVFFTTLLSWINDATPEDVGAAAARWLAGGRHQIDVLPTPEFEAVSAGVDRSQGLPAVGSLPGVVFPEVRHARLSNGIPVILAERHAVPLVEVAIQFDAGYAADAGGAAGTASFSLAMLEQSTRNRSALEVEAETDLLGARISSGSSLDTSTVTLSALSANLAPSLSLFADVVLNPAFAPEEVEHTRGRLIAGVQQEMTEPFSIALRTLPPLIYGSGHPYGIPFTGSGTEASLDSISRDELVAFHQHWLRPDNAGLFVAGDSTLEKILPLLEQAFGHWQTSTSERPQKSLPLVDLPRGGRLLVVDKPGSPQSLILAAHVVPPTGVKNNLTIEIINDILGGTYAARVNQNLRVDKRWSYGAYTLLSEARGQRPWLVYAPVQTDHTADAVAELMGEFQRFVTTGTARQDELFSMVRSRSFSLPGQYETNGAVLAALLQNDRFERPDDYVSRLKERYQAITLESARQTAKQVLHPDKLTWVIVGDKAKISAGLQQLQLAPLEFMDADGSLLPE